MRGVVAALWLRDGIHSREFPFPEILNIQSDTWCICLEILHGYGILSIDEKLNKDMFEEDF
jgi:hypothetical protein